MSVHEVKKIAMENAVARLEEAVNKKTHHSSDPIVEEMMRDSIIKRFEFTLETSWKFLRYTLLDEGVLKEALASPKKTIREAYANGLIQDGQVWVDMINGRNLSAHIYNEDTAERLEAEIITKYLPAFKALLQKLT